MLFVVTFRKHIFIFTKTMARIKYLSNCVKKGDAKNIVRANRILQEYAAAGYRVTLRQLYYQFVARNFLQNSDSKYKKLCESVRRGRMEGLIDWDMIEDRTRILRLLSRWKYPAHIVDACANQFHVDYWVNQQCRTEVWIEKDALLGVIEDTCERWDCPYFSCRGYPSTSELHEASLRIKRYKERGQDLKIFYCGDHDPSGLNMGDAITQTLKEFGTDFEFERIALNMDQIGRFNPPPNRIKERDTRSPKYREKYGDECWELDALPPNVLNEIVEKAIVGCINDMDDFNSRRTEDAEGRNKLRLVSKHFDTAYRHVESYLGYDDDE